MSGGKGGGSSVFAGEEGEMGQGIGRNKAKKRRRVSPAAPEGRYQYTQGRDSYIFVLEEM